MEFDASENRWFTKGLTEYAAFLDDYKKLTRPEQLIFLRKREMMANQNVALYVCLRICMIQ